MYLDSVKFKQDHRCFKKDETYEMENLTLLVGDQGCGKSSLLNLLKESCDKETLDLSLSEKGNAGVNTYFFDFEKDNPRIKDPQLYTNINGTNKGIGFGNALKSRFISHGEMLVGFSITPIKKAKNCVIFLDEPESSLSIRNQFKLLKEINKAVERDCQFIIATHCLPLISEQGKVLSLEHKKWMTSKDFIESQKKG